MRKTDTTSVFRLRMIGINSEVGEKKRLATWLVTASIRFYRHKYGINLRKRPRIIALQDPAFLGRTILVEYAEVDRLSSIGSSSTPRLKCAGVL